MSEHHFGLSRKRVTAEMGKRLDRIAKKHDATFTWGTFPDGYKAWFSCENLGHPFDKATSEAVLKDVAAAGITYPGL